MTEDGVTSLVNGSGGVVFPWRTNDQQFFPDLDDPVSVELMFERCFDNLIEATPQQALALIRAWLMFLLFRTDSVARPILALLGQPGSGKSTLFRRLYVLIYGPSKGVNAITSPEDFDHAVSSDPLVVFDNVDTFAPWLPDRLAISAASSDLSKRKLYTDNDTVTVVRSALLGLTAHNPQFRREDIVDRLVMLNFHRLSSFLPESDIIANLIANRDRLWGGIVNDAVKMLRTPKPNVSEIPAFRVSDFARIGVWAARALGFENDFREAIGTNVSEQKQFNLEEEDLLIDTIRIWLARGGGTEFKDGAELWQIWSGLARDSTNFQKLYRNAMRLSRKLWSLQETLQLVFKVDVQHTTDGRRLWRFAPKDEEG